MPFKCKSTRKDALDRLSRLQAIKSMQDSVHACCVLSSKYMGLHEYKLLLPSEYQQLSDNTTTKAVKLKRKWTNYENIF